MKNIKNRDPLKTKTGKTRLGPLSLTQLEELVVKASTKKDRGRYRQRLDQLRKILKVDKTQQIV